MSYWNRIEQKYIVKSWSTFTFEQQRPFTQMNNFFCGLHFLIGLADSSTEHYFRMKMLLLGSGPGTTCKAVQKHFSQLAGCHVLFKAYFQSPIFPMKVIASTLFSIVLLGFTIKRLI